MQRKTPQKRVLFVRDPKLAILGVLSMFSILAGLLFSQQPVVAAATDSTINFQARLLTAPGSVAPDGNYNVEFKIYNALTSSGSSQGSCTGDANCLWTETRTSGNTVHVVNGYLTVNLGSVTAFPTTINWDQDTYLSMNIGGTGGSPTWDGEMSPRLHLTAVPYAFRAGQLAQYNATTGYTSTLNLVQPTGGNQIFNIPDQGAAGTYSLLTTNTANANYIQLQGTTPGTAQTGNFNITGTGIAGVALQTPALDRATAGTLTIGATNATAVTIGPATTMNHSLTLNGGSSGATTFTTPQGSSVSTTINIPLYNPGAFGQILAFGLPNGSSTMSRALSVFDDRTGNSDVQPAINLLSPGESDLLGFSWDGSNLVGSVKTESSSLSFKTGSTSMMYLNKLGGVGIGLGFVSPNYTLDVAGDTNISTGSVYRIGGTAICSASGCTPAAGSSNYIQLQGTTPGTAQTGNFNITGTGIAGVALQTPLLDTASAGTLSIGTSTATSLSLAKTGVTTTVNGGTIFTPSTGYSSGVNSTITASLVTNNTVLPITATTTGLTFTMPTTSIGSAGRVVYVTNTGSNPFLLNIGSATMTFTTSSTATLYWNGTAWTSAGLDNGVTAIGALDLQSANANGASIVANLLYLQSASASFPGLVNTTAQTFAGAKTFSALITGNAGATIGTGPIALTGNNASSFTTTAGALTLTSASTAIWSTSGAGADLTVEANGANNLKLLTTGAGTVALGDISTTTINIGRGSNIARTISIGNGGTSQAQTISIGSIGGASTLALAGGTGATAITLTPGANGNVVTTTTGTGNINLNTAASIIAKSTTNSTTAFQVQDSGTNADLNVDTTNGGLTTIATTNATTHVALAVNSGAAGYSGVQLTDLNSSSSTSSTFSQLLGVDSSGNVGLSSAGVSLTSPALAYWDGLNDPTTTGNSYPQATVQSLGSTTYTPNYTGTTNGEQLTNQTGNETGVINWNFSQVPFEETQFQFKSSPGGASPNGADGVWFYSYADNIPTTEFGGGGTFSKGYIVYFSEYHGCAGITYGTFTDGNQCNNGGGTSGAGTSPLKSVAVANLANGSFHSVDVMILQNQITVRLDGAVILQYSDIYTRDTSHLNYGFGSRTGAQYDNHYIKGLLVTKLGTNPSEYNINNVNPLTNNTSNAATNMYWNNSAGALGIDTYNPGAQLEVDTTTTTSIGQIIQGMTGQSADLLEIKSNGSGTVIDKIDSAGNLNVKANVSVGTGSDGASPFSLAVDGGTANPTQINGGIYYNTSTNSFRCGQTSAWVSCQGLVDSIITTSTLSNPTSNTAFGQNYTVPAGDCQPGVTYHVTASGTITSGGNYTFNVGLYLNGVAGTKLGSAPGGAFLGGTATNWGWHEEADIVCDTNGTGGTVETQGVVIIGAAAGSSVYSFANTATATWNTTTTNTIGFASIFGTSSGTNSVIMRQFIVQRLGN